MSNNNNYASYTDRPQSAPAATNRRNSIHSSAPSSPSTPRVIVPLESRYWSYLFENLNRSVDELYDTCEQDFSVDECLEVIKTLNRSIEDFKKVEFL
jgi:hypothetical protein